MTAVFALTIGLDNAAMEDTAELARAIRTVAALVDDGHTDGPILDVNGNTVGAYTTSRT